MTLINIYELVFLIKKKWDTNIPFIATDSGSGLNRSVSQLLSFPPLEQEKKIVSFARNLFKTCSNTLVCEM